MRNESWVSDELIVVLSRLTARQAEAILRIVQTELEGRRISNLLYGSGRMCAPSTYYGTKKRKGWQHNPEFNRALELARRDYRKWMMEYGVGDALAILVGTAPDAARALRRQVVGDSEAIAALEAMLQSSDEKIRVQAALALGGAGQPSVVPALRAAFDREQSPQVQQVIIEALSTLASWRDGDQRTASFGVLDRADVKTAAKRAFSVNDHDVDSAIERELERLAIGSQGTDAGASTGDAIARSSDGEQDEAIGMDSKAPEAAGAE
jgi:hypothetical protein